ncbi:MAG: hypothetical protein ACK4XM_12670 [Chloroherpetonaceae bacterium]
MLKQSLKSIGIILTVWCMIWTLLPQQATAQSVPLLKENSSISTDTSIRVSTIDDAFIIAVRELRRCSERESLYVKRIAIDSVRLETLAKANNHTLIYTITFLVGVLIGLLL